MGAQIQTSPGVVTREFEVGNIIPTVSVSVGAFAGVFHWGPVEKRILIDSAPNLAQRMGRPSNFNPETWFSASNFLDYTNQLILVRAADVTGNTVHTVHEGNSTNLAITTETNVLKCNTDGILPGMKLFYANNTAVPTDAKVNSVNSTTVTLSAPATANVESVELVFREDITFTAVAQQSDLNYDATDITDWDEQIIKNDDHYASRENGGDAFDASVLYVGKYPGAFGNSLRVAVCDSPSQFHSNTLLTSNDDLIDEAASKLTGVVGSNTFTVTITPVDTANATSAAEANAHAATLATKIQVGDYIEVGNTRLGFQYLTVTNVGALANTNNVYSFTIRADDELKLAANISLDYLARYWEFYNVVDRAPGQSPFQYNNGNTAAHDELHVVVVDEGGKFSGSPGEILETFQAVSRATNAKTLDNEVNYYKEVINSRSRYIWFANDRTTAKSETAEFLSSSTGTHPLSMRLYGGTDGPDEASVPFGTLAFAWDLFQSEEDVDISLVFQGKARGEPATHYTQLANYLIDNITEKRQDCLAFVSPDKRDVVNNPFEELNDVLEFADRLRNSSWGCCDSGYKYQHDKYNDVYRWIPLNGDIAGLCARTDQTNDPWFSPAGLTRGQIKNVMSLAWNPRKAHRDQMYPRRVNPVVTEAGAGTYLKGDRTLLEKASAFDRINVRRLFIVLRKAIGKAARYSLFEQNDDITRAAFRNMVQPYLREVKGRRGIEEFRVICDQSNNGPAIRDAYQFVGDILIKPVKVINFITLNFVAVGLTVSFNEVQNKF